MCRYELSRVRQSQVYYAYHNILWCQAQVYNVTQHNNTPRNDSTASVLKGVDVAMISIQYRGENNPMLIHKNNQTPNHYHTGALLLTEINWDQCMDK